MIKKFDSFLNEIKNTSQYPKVKDPNKVGSYPALTGSGGGYLYDEVLEYRVWNGSYFTAYKTAEEALSNKGKTVALVLQRAGHWVQWTSDDALRIGQKDRLTEWDLDWLEENNYNLIEQYLGSCVDVGNERSYNLINNIFSDATEMAYYVGNPDEQDPGQSQQISPKNFYDVIPKEQVPSKFLKGICTFHFIPKLNIFFIYNENQDVHYFFRK